MNFWVILLIRDFLNNQQQRFPFLLSMGGIVQNNYIRKEDLGCGTINTNDAAIYRDKGKV